MKILWVFFSNVNMLNLLLFFFSFKFFIIWKLMPDKHVGLDDYAMVNAVLFAYLEDL